jgi:hypothetical protein
MAILGLFWALVLGRASVAGGAETRDERAAADHAIPAAATGPAHGGTADGDSRQARRWSLHRHKHSFAFPKIARGDDPNDDETSDDPNDDDDAWDDLTCYDDTDVPIVAWLPVTPACADVPERASAPWTAPPYPPFLTQRRLRC